VHHGAQARNVSRDWERGTALRHMATITWGMLSNMLMKNIPEALRAVINIPEALRAVIKVL
jgi:hypothetical protein